MVQFIGNWWFVLLGIAISLALVAYRGFQTSGSFREQCGTAKENRYRSGLVLGAVIVIGVVAPLIFYGELENVLGETVTTGSYFTFLGGALLLSYFTPERSVVLRGLAEFVYVTFFPRSRKNPLVWGVIMVCLGLGSIVVASL